MGGQGLPVVVRVDPENPDPLIVSRVAEKAARGALVVYPTDTVYGLGTNPLLEDAVKRVYEAKKRPPTRPLPVLVSSVEAAEALVELNAAARLLAERLWPGPLTLVLPARPGVPGLLHAGTGRLGVRMPDHRVALLLIEKAGGSLVGTSANLHGAPSPRTAWEAVEQLDGSVDYVIDAGPAPGGVPSTVLDLTVEPPRIIRQGPVTAEQLTGILGKPVQVVQ